MHTQWILTLQMEMLGALGLELEALELGKAWFEQVTTSLNLGGLRDCYVG